MAVVSSFSLPVESSPFAKPCIFPQIKSNISPVLFPLHSRAARGPPNLQAGSSRPRPRGPAPKPGPGPSQVPASRAGPLSRPASEQELCLPIPPGPRVRGCGRMAHGAGTFCEEQFWEACDELRRPALSGGAWELLVETQGISVYRLLDQVAVRPWRTAGRRSAGGGVGGAPGEWYGQCEAAAGSPEPAGVQELRELELEWGCLQLTLTSAGTFSEFSSRSETRQGKWFVTS